MFRRCMPWLALLVLLPCAVEAADKLPPDVEALPSDSALIITVRVADLLDSPTGKTLRKDAPKAYDELNKELRGSLGLNLEEIERFSFVASEVGNNEPLMIISTRKPVDQAAIVKVVLPEAKEEKRKNKVLFVQKDTRPFRREQFQAVHFVSNHLYIFGARQDIEHWLDRSEEKTGVMQPVRLAAVKNHVVFGLNIEKLNMLFMQFSPPEIEPYKALLAGKVGLVTANLDKTTAQAELTVDFSSDKEATEGLKAGTELLTLSRKALAEELKKAPKQLKDGPMMKLFTQFETGLKAGKLEQNKTVLKGTMSVSSDTEAIAKGVTQMFTEMRQSSSRAEVTSRLQQLGLSMHNYHDVNKTLPPAAIYSKEGKPLLSWRVLLLPYIGQKKLYDEFKLDEPWDSDHNKKLLAKMPDVFKMPGAVEQTKANETFFLVFTGKGTVFHGARAMPLTKIADGTSNTFLIVEANKSVPWTKPEDLPYDAQKPLPKLGFSRADSFLAVYGDGSVRYHKATIKEDSLRLRITPDDGMPIPNDDD